MTTAFDTVRSLDRREIARLGTHLAQLNDEGWLEQSYCAEWRVYQVVSHLASGARLLLGSLAQWFDGAPPVSQEQRQRIWAHFDALAPDLILDPAPFHFHALADDHPLPYDEPLADHEFLFDDRDRQRAIR